MKMKRWIGLLLALVMVLGLFPATALAEGDESKSSERPFKLYDAETGGNEIAADANGNYTVEYVANAGKTVYFRLNDSSASFSESSDISYTMNSGTDNPLYMITCNRISEQIFSVSFKTGANGTFSDETATLIVGETTYLFAFTFKESAASGDTGGNSGTEDTPSIETVITIDGEEYVRLYRAITNDDSSTNYFTDASCAADGDTGLKLCYYDESQKTYVYINNTDYTCTYDYGTLGWDSERSQFVWQPGIAGIGQTGYIYATAKNGGTKYAFPVTVTAPEFGVYTKEPSPQNLTQGFVAKNNGRYTVPCNMTNGTTIYIYWAVGISACSLTSGVAVEINGQSNSVSNLTDTNVIPVKLSASDEISTTIELSITNKYANNTKTIEINFQSSTAPNGNPWMYDGDGNTSISQPADDGCDIQLKFKNEDGTYTYITGTENGDKTISCDEAFGQFVWISSHSAWNWQTGTAIPGTTGYIYATVGTGDTAVTYAIAAEVTAAEVGVYTKEIVNNDISTGYVPKTNGQYKINYSKTGRVVYFYTGLDGCDFTFGSFTNNNDVTISKVNDTILKIELPETSNGNISTRVEFIIVAGGNNNSWSYNLFFTDGTAEDSGDNQGSLPEVSLIDAAHTLKDSEKYPEDTFVEHMGAFTLDGDSNTYYMVPSNRNSPYPHLNGDSSSYEAQTRLMFIEFWRSLGENNYVRVTDTNTLNKIKAAFSDADGNCTLTMDLKATVYYQSPLPDDYPAIYTTPDVDEWRQPITAKFDFGSAGTWLYCASGKIGNQTITSLVRSKIGFSGDIVWTHDTESNVDVITQVNTYLQTVELPDNFGLIVNLPAGIHYGYILVPERLSDDGISFNGVYDEETGTFSTILRGGIQGENRRTHANGIHFIGAGKNAATWSGFSDDCAVNNGKNNYAYFGSCGGNMRNCLVENYDCAMLSSHEIKTGTGNQFKNNKTAVCYKTYEFGGIGDSLKDNLYEDNGIAIHFAEFSAREGLTILGISRSWFINNDVDIRNDLNRNLFIPGNYFAAKDSQGADVLRECRSIPSAEHQREHRVHTYPQAANRQFTAWIYRRPFYKFAPSINPSFAATYAVPVEYLNDITFTLMNENETLAVWTFKKEEE